MPLSFERPEWLWLLAIVPVVIGLPLLLRSLNALPPGRRALALVLRAALLIAIILAIAGAERVRRNTDLAVMFLLDRSRSVPTSYLQRQQQFIEAFRDPAVRPRNDKTGVVAFDGKSNIEQFPIRGVFIDRLTPPIEPDRTDIAQAIRLAMAAFPGDMAKRIVLLSDGNQNAGDVLREVVEAAANGITIDVVPLEYEHEREVYFARLDAPSQANLQDRVALRMVLRSRDPTPGKLVIYHNDTRIDETDVTLRAGITPLIYEVPLNSAGAHRFEARFEPDDPNDDAVAQNNVGRAFTFVHGEGRVLLVSKNRNEDQALLRALEAEHVNVDMISMNQAPEDVLQMLDYNAIVLANVPADMFTEDQKQQLASYVRDMGGGLVMTGGNDGFGAGGWLGSPVEEVMPVRFDIKARKQIPRGALVLIMHTCEMPRANYWAEQIAVAAVKTISSLDYVGLIAYGGGGTNWEVKFQVARNKSAIINRIQKISSMIGDMPQFGPGMEMGYQALIGARDAAQKHMIIISDGDASPPQGMLLSRLARNRITCSTVTIGFGAHVFPAEMRRIAKATGGRFYQANNPRMLPQIFVKEAKIVRRALIREETFQPRLRLNMPEITAGITNDELPQLEGHVLTTPRLAANEFSRVLMTTDREEPLLAIRQCELGKTIAFTSGWWPRWSPAWTSWESFGKLWAQALRWCMRQGQSAEFEVSTQLEGREGQIVVEGLDKDATFLNGLDIAGKVLTPGGATKTVRLHQTGPGRYEGAFPVSADGHYVSMLTYRKPDGQRGMLKTGLSVSYSPEYRELTARTDLLRQIAEQTGGEVLPLDPKQANIFRRPVRPSISKRPIWPWLVGWIVIPLLLLDVASRRLASMVAISVCIEIAVLLWLLGAAGWYPFWWGWLLAILIAEAVGWAFRWRTIPGMIRSIDSELRGLRASEAAAESVSHLKSVRDRVREELAERAEAERHDVSEEATPDAGARFDLGDVGDKPVGDLDQVVGGAKTQEPIREKRRKPPGQAEEEGSTTSRLLRAKRRARDEQKDDETQA